MENKLIPLTEFVNRIDELVPKKNNDDNLSLEIKQFRAIKRYAAFISQPLKLEYFVPGDDEGNVLEEPEWSEPLSVEEQEVYEHEEYIYEKAISNVLFQGFHVTKNFEGIPVLKMIHSNQVWAYLDSKNFSLNFPVGSHNVESIVENNLKLTDAALKQIYG